MNLRCKISLIIIFVVLSAQVLHLQAQIEVTPETVPTEKKQYRPKNTLAIVVTQPLFKGTRIEYERHLNDFFWLHIAPMHFQSKNEFREAESFWGAGGSLGIKGFFDKVTYNDGAFLMLNFDYNYFEIQQLGTFLIEDQWNGFPAFVPTEGIINQTVNRLRGIAYFGLQGNISHFTLGLRFGIGYQHNFIDVERYGTPIMTDSMLDFAYTGYVYQMVIRIGAVF